MTSYVDDNIFPKLVLLEGTTPASPSSGDQKLFIDSSDHKLKRVNSSGTVTLIEGGGTPPAELGYVQATSPFSTASSSYVDVTSMTLTVTVGTRAIMLEYYSPLADNTAGGQARMDVQLFDTTGSAEVGIAYHTPASSSLGSELNAKVRIAPAAGSRSYKVRLESENASVTCRLFAGATQPMWFRIYEV